MRAEAYVQDQEESVVAVVKTVRCLPHGLEFPILFPLWEAVEEKDGDGERLCYRVEQKAQRG